MSAEDRKRTLAIIEGHLSIDRDNLDGAIADIETAIDAEIMAGIVDASAAWRKEAEVLTKARDVAVRLADSSAVLLDAAATITRVAMSPAMIVRNAEIAGSEIERLAKEIQVASEPQDLREEVAYWRRDAIARLEGYLAQYDHEACQSSTYGDSHEAAAIRVRHIRPTLAALRDADAKLWEAHEVTGDAAEVIARAKAIVDDASL